MPLNKCEKHEGAYGGLNAGEHVCTHINKALKNKAKISFTKVDLGFEGAIWLCPNCLEKFNKLPNEDELDDGESKEQEIDEFYKQIEPCCISCFEEWKEFVCKEES